MDGEGKYYKFINNKRMSKRNLEGIQLAKRRPIDYVQIANWVNWDSSFWIKIKRCDRSIVVDSGIIEGIAKEIKKLKGDKK